MVAGYYSSGLIREASWTGFVRVSLVEFLDKRRVVNKAFSGFPGQLVIANPADKVMQGLVSAAAHELGIHDLIDFEIRFFINDHWRRRRGYLAWERVRGCRL